MITLINAHTTVSQLKKRPNKKDKWIKQVFRDQPFKRVVRYALPWYYMLYRWYHLCGSKVASTSSLWFHSRRGVYIEPLIPYYLILSSFTTIKPDRSSRNTRSDNYDQCTRFRSCLHSEII